MKRIYYPVCCRRPDGEMTTEANPCECINCGQSGNVLFAGACEKPRQCSCQCFHAPVCCKHRDGSLGTSPNSCQCTQCNKGSVLSKGVCGNQTITNPSAPGTDMTVSEEEPEEEVKIDEEEEFVGKEEEEEEMIGGEAFGGSNVTNETTNQPLQPTEPTVRPPGVGHPICICPFDFKPVCCIFKDDKSNTTANSCICTKVESGMVSAEGECPKTGVTSSAPKPACKCPRIYDPVCCRLPDGKHQTAANACECNCKSGTVINDSVCTGEESCPCPKIYNPVCCKLESGKKRTVANKCYCTSFNKRNSIVVTGSC